MLTASATKAMLFSLICSAEQWLLPTPGPLPPGNTQGREVSRVAFIVSMAGAGPPLQGAGAQGHHCFKDMVQEPRACLIQERGWWDVGRFS